MYTKRCYYDCETASTTGRWCTTTSKQQQSADRTGSIDHHTGRRIPLIITSISTAICRCFPSPHSSSAPTSTLHPPPKPTYLSSPITCRSQYVRHVLTGGQRWRGGIADIFWRRIGSKVPDEKCTERRKTTRSSFAELNRGRICAQNVLLPLESRGTE